MDMYLLKPWQGSSGAAGELHHDLSITALKILKDLQDKRLLATSEYFSVYKPCS